jgi:hypothetical protein
MTIMIGFINFIVVKEFDGVNDEKLGITELSMLVL